MQDDVAAGVFSMVKKLLLKRLKELHVNVVTKSKINRMVRKKLSYTVYGVEKLLEFDDVVLAVGNKPDETFAKLKGHEKYTFVGDCNVVATGVEAIRNGAEISLKI